MRRSPKRNAEILEVEVLVIDGDLLSGEIERHAALRVAAIDVSTTIVRGRGRIRIPRTTGPMRFTLRPWTDHDTGTDREISRSNYPEYREDPAHPAWFPAPQLGAPRAWSSRYLVEHDTGNAVAYATLWDVRSGRYRFDLAVRPEFQRQGVGTDLLGRVI